MATHAQRAPKARKALGTTLTVALSATLLGALPLTAATSASAAEGLTGTAHAGHYWANGEEFVGNYQMSDGSIAWCAFDTGLDAPIQGTSTWGSFQDTSDSSFVAGGGASGIVIQGDAYKRIAYLLGKYGNTSDNDIAAAVYRVMHTPEYTGVSPAYSGQAAATDGVAGLAADMWAEAGQYAGDYSLNTPDMRLPDTEYNGTILPAQYVDVDLHAVYAASGAMLPDTTLTATIDGPGVWEENGQKTITYTGENTKRITSTGDGVISVTTSATTPGTKFKVASPSGNAQRLVLAGDTGSISRTSRDVEVFMTFQPTATSTAWTYDADTSEKATFDEDGNVVKATYPLIGDQLVDTVHASAADGSWAASVPVTYRVDWYYSATELPTSEDVPSSATLFDSTTVTADKGAGDYDAKSKKTIDKEGFYYPVVSFTKSDQPKELQRFFNGDWSAPFHDDSEQTISPWQPKVTTKTSDVSDGTISDSIEVTGNDPEAELTVVSKLYMTDEDAVEGGTDSAPEDAVLVGTVETKITGNGTVKTASIDVPWYDFIERDEWPNLYWQESIARTPTTEGWTGKHLIPDETYELVRPTVVTKTTPEVSLPADVHDTATVTGTVPVGNKSNPLESKLTFDLYKWDDSTDGDAQPLCGYAFWSQKTPVSVTAEGVYDSETASLKTDGTYGYQETFYVSMEGKEDYTLHKGACGAEGETVIAKTPTTPTSVTKTAKLAKTGASDGLSVAASFAALLGLAGGAAATTQIVRRRKESNN